jgi:hypothetical protein
MATAARAVMGRDKPKQKADPAVRLARSIGVPEAQIANGQFKESNVANFTEAQQRHAVRSKEVKTVKRMSHIDKLVARRTLTMRQGQLCQWYADQREIGYATVGCTANYCGAGGGGFGSSDLLARYSEQAIARNNYSEARQSIDLRLLPMFERIVIAGWSMAEAGERKRPAVISELFRLAVDQLEQGIGHLVTER